MAGHNELLRIRWFHHLSCLSAIVMESRLVRFAKHEMCFTLSMLFVPNRRTLSQVKVIKMCEYII